MTRTLHLVSHTHWDREWYQTFQQFRLRLVHLVDGVLDLMKKDPRFRFFMLDGQTIVLDDYLEVRPEREAEIRRLVRAGRLIIGPWRILPDEFLVGPEAHIRNLLRGEADCRRFGPKMNIGYIPDPFGHIGQMPQILRGFGIEAACLQRGLDDQPVEFWWQAPDGSRVLMLYLRDGYGNAAGLPSADADQFIAEVKRLRDSLAPHARSSHLLLMHGTDHMEPPPTTAGLIAAARGKLDGDHLIHSTLPAYLKAVQGELRRADLPVLAGELRSSKRFHLLPGVLSARMWIKQRNAASESLLEKWAEPFSAFAARAGRVQPAAIRDPQAALRVAWGLLMQNHPHDSICGCSIDQVHDEMRPRFDQVDQIGEEITRQSLGALAAATDTRSGYRDAFAALVVFNPSCAARTDRVTVELTLPQDAAGFEIVDEQGKVLPHQADGLGGRDLIHVRLTRDEVGSVIGNLHEGRAGNLALRGFDYRREGSEVVIQAVMSEEGAPDMRVWARANREMKALLADPGVTHFRIRARTGDAARATFVAPEVPGLGRRTFWARARTQSPAPARISPLARLLMPLGMRLVESAAGQWLISRLSRTSARGPKRIENEFFVIEAERDGTLRLTDKRDGRVLRGLNRFVDGGDCGDEYNYCPPDSDRAWSPRPLGARVEKDAVGQRLILDLELRAPRELSPDRKARGRTFVRIPIVTTVTLTPGVARAEIHTRLDNRARDHRLRVHFPAPVHAATAEHDGHFEVVRRPVGPRGFDQTWAEDPRPEVPQRAFTSVGDGRQGLTVAVRGLPEVEVIPCDGGTEIAVTLLRCVGWLSRDDFPSRRNHAGPFLPTPGAQMPGIWEFNYAVIPGAGEEARRLAYEFQTALRAMPVDLHAGALAPAGSFVEVSGLEITSVKESEDGRGFVVRGVNLSEREARVSLRPWRRFARVERVNLAERRLGELRPGSRGSVQLTARGHEIVSVLFRD